MGSNMFATFSPFNWGIILIFSETFIFKELLSGEPNIFTTKEPWHIIQWGESKYKNRIWSGSKEHVYFFLPG